MELRDIEYFAAIAQHGHLGRAAEALGLSISALSKSLRRLEQSMQAKLVTRTPKGVELTTEGNTLLAHVIPLRLSLRDITQKVSDLSKGRSGHLNVGANPGPAEHLFPLALGKLLAGSQNVHVSLTVNGALTLVPELRNGNLDLILMSLAPRPYEGIVQEHLYDEEFSVYASASHRLAKRKRVTVAELELEEWALPSLAGIVVGLLHRAYEDNRLAPPRVALTGGNLQNRLLAIASSHLLGIAPKRTIRQVARHLGLAEIPIEGLAYTRKVGIGIRNDVYLSPVARRFIEILKVTAKAIASEK